MGIENDGIVPVEAQDKKDVRLLKGKEAHDHSVEAGASWIFSRLDKNKKYSERIPLNRDRTFNVPRDITELPADASDLVRAANKMEYSQSGLYELARSISKKHPELRFAFKVDPEGRWIEYSVEKQVLKIGDEVKWINQDIGQWEHPKKIKSIDTDPRSKRSYAFVEGVVTGIPLDELILS